MSEESDGYRCVTPAVGHAACRPYLLFKGVSWGRYDTPCTIPAIMSYSPLQVIQFRLGLSILVLNTLSAFYLPEIMGYLNRRWRSCQPFESAREWVLIIKREFIPLLEDIHADDDLEIEREAEKLRDATARYALLL